MARIRSVKPEFFVSPTLAKVTLSARLTFIGLWTEADDEGRLIDSPKMLAGALFPFDADVDAKQVDKWLTELAQVGVITRYAAGHGLYIQVNNWTEHQRVPHARASTVPEPPRKTNARRASGSRTPHEPFAPEREREREQGTAHVPCAREPELDTEFTQCWNLYPKRKRESEALKAFRARRREGIELADLLRATENYARAVQREGTPEKFVMFGATFYGPNHRWKDHLEAQAQIPLYDTTTYPSPV